MNKGYQKCFSLFNLIYFYVQRAMSAKVSSVLSQFLFKQKRISRQIQFIDWILQPPPPTWDITTVSTNGKLDNRFKFFYGFPSSIWMGLFQCLLSLHSSALDKYKIINPVQVEFFFNPNQTSLFFKTNPTRGGLRSPSIR